MLHVPVGELTPERMKAMVAEGFWLAFARFLASLTAKDAVASATACAIFFDKWRLSEGLPTAITDERRVERVELLQKIHAVLESRGVAALRRGDE